MNPVDRVTIHHRGGGSPSDVSSDYSEGGYTYGIGLTRWEWFRDVWHSFATLGFNHVSVDVCLSGNRMTSPVTDSDIILIRGALADARARGYVVDHPQVVPHRNSPGSATVCPGDFTMNRWADVVAACQAGPPPAPKPSPLPVPKEEPMLIRAKTQPTPNRFRGAKVDFATQTVTARGGAAIVPNPSEVLAGKTWDGADKRDPDPTDGESRFTVVTVPEGGESPEFTFRVK